jgi:hypothetical protein
MRPDTNAKNIADIIIYILLAVTSLATTYASTPEPSRLLVDVPTVPLTVPPSPPDYRDPEAVEALVREVFADAPVMVEVIRCESSMRHLLPSGEVLRGRIDSRDTGAAQINLYYHQAAAERMGLDVEDIHDNLAYAKHLYETEGLQPWSASSKCWSG